jgi:hypothetical protein
MLTRLGSVGRWDESRSTVSFHSAPPEGLPRRAPIDRAIRRVHAGPRLPPAGPARWRRRTDERVEADPPEMQFEPFLVPRADTVAVAEHRYP